MRTIYWHSLVWCLLAALNSQAQINQATSPSAGTVSAVGTAGLRAASNAVQAASIVWLTNQVLEATTAVSAGVQRLGVVGGFRPAPGLTAVIASTNASQPVTSTRLPGQALPTATVSRATSQSRGAMATLDAGGGCVRPGSGLVSWWQGEGDASDSAGNNPGELVNGAYCDSGMVGSGFSFYGPWEESVEIPYATNMVTPTFSMEAWVYPSGQPDGQAAIFSQAYGRQLVVWAGQTGLKVAMFVADENGTFYGASPLGEIPAGDWTHLAGTWDGTYLKLYTNGVMAAQGTPGISAIGDSTCGFSIGGFNGSCGSGQYFSGVIDEVSLYDRALFPGEVNAIFSAGSAGKCKSPPSCVSYPPAVVAWWPFEGDASDAFRHSPGVRQNGPNFAPGKVGQALNFNGVNQCVSVAYSPGLASTNFSVEAWVNPSGQVGSQSQIIGQGYGRQLDLHPGNVGLNVAFYVCTDPWHWYHVDSSGEIPIGEWTHLVGTWDGTHLKLYINGALDQQATPGIVSWDSGCSFNIAGAWNSCGASGQFFNGLIDEPAVYKAALSAADVQALYNAGSAGKCNIPGTWLAQYFGPNYATNLDAAIDADPDHDGATNLEEYEHGIDPTKGDTDGDGLSDGAEIHYYGSDPANSHTFNPVYCDSEYFHAAKAGVKGLTYAELDLDILGGGLLRGSISGSPPLRRWDVYYVNSIIAQRWQWRRVLAGIKCDDAGEATFEFQAPESPSFFMILSAEDWDGDGLTDGYEAWFHHNGLRTNLQDYDSDRDLMYDGWEVEYGLDPTVSTGKDGGGFDWDGDSLLNLVEHNDYYNAARKYDATYDPGKAGPNQRPVITVAPAAPPTLGFTISRDSGSGGTKPTLTVYYALGGSAQYGAAHDYQLTPAPAPAVWPRICAVDIPFGADSVTVTIAPTAAWLARGPLSVVVALTPYGVAAQPQESESNSLNWQYAVDWNHNRATIGFAGRADGFMINLNKDPVTGLTIKPTATTAPPPFVNVASSGRGTVARIEIPNQWDPAVTEPKVVGEYYTTPTSAPTSGHGNPSRTTVDRYGNVWVANRDVSDGGGSIAKIGVVIGGTRCDANGSDLQNGQYLKPPFIYNTCIDRDGDGLIHTSYGLNNALTWTDPALLTPGDGDEAVTYYVRTTPTLDRSIVVDSDNNVWVGSRDDGWQELIDALTGAPITGQKFHYGSGGYGGVIDPYGVLWSTGYTAGHNDVGVLRLLPGAVAGTLPGTAGAVLPNTFNTYGIGIDPTTADVWAGSYNNGSSGSGGIWHFKQNGCWFRLPFSAPGNGDGNGLKGVVVDGTGDIWVAHPGTDNPPTGNEVYRFRDTPGHPGEYRGRVILEYPPLSGNLGTAPHGACIDSQGRVWAICFGPATTDGKYYAMRIDPSSGVDPLTGNIVGKVDAAVDLGAFLEGYGPYNYSDMTGFVTLSTTQPAGVWDFVEDSSQNYTLWSYLTLDGDLNSGNIVIEARAADRITDLPSWPFRRLTGSTGTILFGTPALKGRYLEVRVNVLRSFGATQSPVVRSLSLAWGSPGSDLQIQSHPRSQVVALGAPSVEFTVTATPPGLTYQWLRDGVEVGSSSKLTINNPQYGDAGKYHVRVTDAAGSILDSAEARLHVVSTPGSVPSVTPAPTTTPTLNQPVTFTAEMDVAPPGDVHYQWRKNGVPIPGQSGLCSTSGNQTYHAAAYQIGGACGDTATYSVVFTNVYWKVASAGTPITVVDGFGQAIPQVTLNLPSPYSIANRYDPPTVTAYPCFNPLCTQWYLATDTYGVVWIPIADAPNALEYPLPKPVPCDYFSPPGRVFVEVFDEGRIPHAATIQFTGTCP